MKRGKRKKTRIEKGYIVRCPGGKDGLVMVVSQGDGFNPPVVEVQQRDGSRYFFHPKELEVVPT